jgi:arylsulfatase A-like enzyme
MSSPAYRSVRALLVHLIPLPILFATSCSRPAPVSARHPDVFLLVVDTLRKDRLGCYGYPRPTSPNLDRLSREGTLFEDATAQASWTKLSMVSLLQGHYVTDYRDVFEEKPPTLAEVFHQAGYRTIGVVGNILLTGETTFGRGFDHYDSRGPAKDESGSDGSTRNAAALFRVLWPELERARATDSSGVRPPLFVYVHLMDPHFPYLRHPEFDAELPLEGAATIPDRLRETFAREGAPAPPEDPGWAQAWKGMQEARGGYDQEVRYADREIGLFLDRLRAEGLLDHALIALVADHGEVLFEQVAMKRSDELAKLAPDPFFQREHGLFLFESLIGTPFVLWGEGVAKGMRVKEPVENLDLFPTLTDLAGLPTPPGLHGRSLSGIVQGRGSAPREEVRAFVRQCVAVREIATGLKLTLPTEAGAAQGARPTLYCLGEDPGEIKNLYDERPEDAERLRRRIAAWIERYPTVSSIHRKKNAKELQDMKKLGYAGEEKQ